MEHTTKKGYIETVGRRKTATARVRIVEAPKNSITVNDKDVNEYFKTDNLRNIAAEALAVSKTPGKFKITVKVVGGGINGQAEAVRLGISRALIVDDKPLRGTLKKVGFLKRDPRAKERRKFGLKKARKAPQWSKR
jgi:small subunit ribosomal protein S9